MNCLQRLPRLSTSKTPRNLIRIFSTTPRNTLDGEKTFADLLATLDAPGPDSRPLARLNGRKKESPLGMSRTAPGTGVVSVPVTYDELSMGNTKLELARQMPRQWRSGDVFAPHDLGSVEAMKWKKLQLRPEKDVFDMLATNPMKHYKNFKLMSEFLMETGRIKHSSKTGLRPRNQRRMAKAVRRAIGIGLLPSVYLHPEIQASKLGITFARGA